MIRECPRCGARGRVTYYYMVGNHNVRLPIRAEHTQCFHTRNGDEQRKVLQMYCCYKVCRLNCVPKNRKKKHKQY